MNDDLGDRIKSQYENRTRYYLPRRTYTVVRVDGKNFHGFTRSLERPFDLALMEDMDKTAVFLCAHIEGCVLAYVQSDEISLLLTDFAAAKTQAWFDGNLQKIVSITASLATGAFNAARTERRLRAVLEAPASLRPDVTELLSTCLTAFDARAFTIPDPVEVENYFLWRQQDATRNSISMAAQAVLAHDALQGKDSGMLQELLWQRGINWNDYPAGCKRGRIVVRRIRRETVAFTHGKTGEVETAEVDRAFWSVEAPPVFSRERAYLQALLPCYEQARVGGQAADIPAC